MRKHLYKCLVLLSWVASVALAAQVPDDLYSTDIIVHSQSAHERSQALATALEKILVRASADASVLDDPLLEPARQNVMQWLETYHYKTNSASENPAAQSEKVLHVTFQAQAIHDILSDMGRSAWFTERPLVLVWVVVQDETQQRQVLSNDGHDQLSQQLQAMMSAHGLPMVLPVLDLAMIDQLPVESIWQADFDALSAVAKRYSANAQVVIRLQNDDIRGWRADATLFTEAQRYDFVANQHDQQHTLASIIDQLGVRLAAIYAPEADTQQQTAVALTVKNISNLDAYASLMDYLNKFAVIKDIELLQLTPEQVELALTVAGDNKRLQQAFSAQHHLLADNSELQRQGYSEHLVYRWNP